MRTTSSVVTFCLLLSARLGVSATPLPPKPTRYVTDSAGIFSSERRDALNERLAAFERETSNQVIVYVDRSIPQGTSLEEMGSAALREWGVGQKGRSNGVILFVFVNDRAMRLEVGYGLEGKLPDARARQITSDVIKPLFKTGDYPGGVEAGVGAILAAARGEAFAGTGRTASERHASSWAHAIWGVVLGFLALVLVVGVFGKTRRGLAVLLVWLIAGLNLVGGVMLGDFALFGVFLLFDFCALMLTLSWFRSMAASRASAGSPFWRSVVLNTSESSSSGSSVSSSDSGSSGSSSGSDFSGGGGDGGGGGSSDSW